MPTFWLFVTVYSKQALYLILIFETRFVVFGILSLFFLAPTLAHQMKHFSVFDFWLMISIQVFLH